MERLERGQPVFHSSSALSLRVQHGYLDASLQCSLAVHSKCYTERREWHELGGTEHITTTAPNHICLVKLVGAIDRAALPYHFVFLSDPARSIWPFGLAGLASWDEEDQEETAFSTC